MFNVILDFYTIISDCCPHIIILFISSPMYTLIQEFGGPIHTIITVNTHDRNKGSIYYKIELL